MAGQCRTTAAGAVQARHAFSSGAVGISENLWLETAPPPGASVATTNAATKRRRSLGDDAQNRLATLLTACALAGDGRCDSPQQT